MADSTILPSPRRKLWLTLQYYQVLEVVVADSTILPSPRRKLWLTLQYVLSTIATRYGVFRLFCNGQHCVHGYMGTGGLPVLTLYCYVPYNEYTFNEQDAHTYKQQQQQKLETEQKCLFKTDRYI